MNMYESLRPETTILILSTQQKSKILTLTLMVRFMRAIQSYTTLLVGKFCEKLTLTLIDFDRPSAW